MVDVVDHPEGDREERRRPPATAGLRLPVCLLPETDTCAGWGCSSPPSTEGLPVRAVRVKLVDFWVPLKSVKVVEHRCYRKGVQSFRWLAAVDTTRLARQAARGS